MVGLEGSVGVRIEMVVLRAAEDFAFRGLRVERGDLGEPILAGFEEPV